MAIPKRTAERIRSGLKRFHPILKAQRDRDVSEADTVTVCKDLLSDVFGYDKYAEITGEHAIRGTYCDLAVQFDGKLQLLIEVKSIGLDLNERHVKQAIDYAANQGVDWVVLTNAVEWHLFHVLFQKPIDKELVARLNLLEMDARRATDLERLFLLAREGIKKNALHEFRDRADATSRFMLAAIVLSDSVITAVRKEVRRVSDILVDKSVIEKTLREQVIKREAMEGDQAEDAKRRLSRKRGPGRRKKERAPNVETSTTVEQVQES